MSEEKILIVEVIPKENDYDMVQTMLSTMLANETIVHENVVIDYGYVISQKFYKGLCYGQINDKNREEMARIEKEGYRRKFILCFAAMDMDPCIELFGKRLDECFIESNKKYIFKLKIVYERYAEDDGKKDFMGINGRMRRFKNKVAMPF